MRNTVRCATKFLVAGFGILLLALPAKADIGDEIDLDNWNDTILMADESPRDDGDRELEPWESDPDEEDIAFDNRRIKRDKRNRLGLIFAEINLGGGVVRSLDAGPEISMFSTFGYGNASLRFAQIGLSSKVLLQIGVSLSAESSFFDNRQYEGDQLRVGAGFEFALLFMGHKRPKGMWVQRIRAGIIHEEGRSLISLYKLGFQDNTFLDFEGYVETYVLAQETGEKTYAWGGRQVIREAWLHATQLSYRFIIQLHSERHEPGFNESRNSTNSRYEFGLTQWVFKSGWEQGEYALGAVLGVHLSHAAGYRSVSHDNIVTTVRAGITARVQLYKNVYLYATPTVGYNARTDGWDWGLTANLAVNFW